MVSATGENIFSSVKLSVAYPKTNSTTFPLLFTKFVGGPPLNFFLLELLFSATFAKSSSVICYVATVHVMLLLHFHVNLWSSISSVVKGTIANCQKI